MDSNPTLFMLQFSYRSTTFLLFCYSVIIFFIFIVPIKIHTDCTPASCIFKIAAQLLQFAVFKTTLCCCPQLFLLQLSLRSNNLLMHKFCSSVPVQ